jgi:2-polyprenyl-3-methyl-5-hydroxy-6-metoxy-1,4-benzoquinol methylase
VVCGADQLVATPVILGYGTIHRCRACGSGVMLPRPSGAALAGMHGAAAYFDHPYFQDRRTLTADLEARFRRRLESIRAVAGDLAGRTVVEVGCDTGLFLGYLAAESGATAVGVDVSEHAVAAGRKAGLDIRKGTLEELGLDAASVDVVCAYDLIEHLADPGGFAGEVARVLRPGGFFFAETPNFDGLIYRLGRALAWPGPPLAPLRAIEERLWPAFHVQYFGARSVRDLFAAHGFDEVAVGGRELGGDEIAVQSAPLRLVIAMVSRIAAALSMHTLIALAARRMSDS